jgi:hypothetical protein
MHTVLEGTTYGTSHPAIFNFVSPLSLLHRDLLVESLIGIVDSLCWSHSISTAEF